MGVEEGENEEEEEEEEKEEEEGGMIVTSSFLSYTGEGPALPSPADDGMSCKDDNEEEDRDEEIPP